MEIACEGGDRGHTYYYFVDFVVLPGANDALDDGGADFVAYWVLGVRGCGDEELVFDVNEVLTIVDYLDVGVCDRMLCLISVTKFFMKFEALTSVGLPLLHLVQLRTN